jgi:glycosyltransferase involved in cell wall biosynthesis
MSKVVIDARESGSSTGRYIDKVLENLSQLEPNLDVAVLTKSHRVDAIKKLTPNFTVIESPYKEFTFGEQLGLRKQLAAQAADLVHFGMVQQPLLFRGKAVTTIHDLTTLRFINPVKNPIVFGFKQLVYKYVVKRAARRSKFIITGSEFTRQDIAEYSGVSKDKIIVAYLAADPIPDPAELVDGLASEQFIMYVGRPMPHKNLERLIESFVLLKAQHPNLKLVLAGKKDANYRRIEAGVKKRGLDNVIFTDFVSEGQLRWLYENCAAYIFPSLSEGFGLPGLEAMIHGAPVVSSNATCLPEIYGDAAHYFDPHNIQAMTDAINEVLTDKTLRETLIRAGMKQVAKYSWQQTAEKTLSVYKAALNRK